MQTGTMHAQAASQHMQTGAVHAQAASQHIQTGAVYAQAASQHHGACPKHRNTLGDKIMPTLLGGGGRKKQPIVVGTFQGPHDALTVSYS